MQIKLDIEGSLQKEIVPLVNKSIKSLDLAKTIETKVNKSADKMVDSVINDIFDYELKSEIVKAVREEIAEEVKKQAIEALSKIKLGENFNEKVSDNSNTSE